MKINKKKIYDYVEQHHTSVRTVEDRAGLARNAIHNILTDKSKNPGLETIAKISKILECSIDELVNLENSVGYHKIECTKKSLLFKEELYRNIFDFLMTKFAEKNFDSVTLNYVSYCIESIYEYSYLNNNTSIDYNFAKWFIENYKT